MGFGFRVLGAGFWEILRLPIRAVHVPYTLDCENVSAHVTRTRGRAEYLYRTWDEHVAR